jgi:MFS family permease
VAIPLELVGFFITTMSIPSLRAGLSDAVPANLRGAGFGAFNLCSVLFGQAAAPLILFGISGAFDDNLRTALLAVTPPVIIGALLLLRARDHLDEDAAKIFEAIVTAMQEQQERDAQGQA